MGVIKHDKEHMSDLSKFKALLHKTQQGLSSAKEQRLFFNWDSLHTRLNSLLQGMQFKEKEGQKD